MSSEDPEVFVSYAVEELRIAKRLTRNLLAAGVRAWLDRAPPGWRPTLSEELQNQAAGISPVHVVLLSPASVASSRVIDFLEGALEYKRTPVPILIAECTPLAQLDGVEIIDLRGDYKKGFRRVLKRILATLP